MFWRKKNKTITEPVNTIQETTDVTDINVVIKTDLGNIRTNNEDTAGFYRIADKNILSEKGYLLIVADGMGGHNAGEVASNMAVEIINKEYYSDVKSGSIEKSLSQAFVAANKKIFDQASSNDACKGMGTTCTAIVIAGNVIYYAHAGDSRAYLARNRSVYQLTEDHTYVRDLVKSGAISAKEADDHPQRNILTNAMGTKADMRLDVGKSQFSFEENDRLLLCSDGLYDYLNDAELADMMDSGTLLHIAGVLINIAKKRGGKDNITVVLAEKKMIADDISEKLTRDVDISLLTRDADISLLTRDADLPTDI